ncbi:hypothetical protein D3C86_1097040 [compost metagenome]
MRHVFCCSTLPTLSEVALPSFLLQAVSVLTPSIRRNRVFLISEICYNFYKDIQKISKNYYFRPKAFFTLAT